jgi:hypothetical protein
MSSLANRIDSNVAHYERVVRELPSAELSITLPILVIGIAPDASTRVIDLRDVAIPLDQLSGKGRRIGGSDKTSSEVNRYRLINALFEGRDPHHVTETSDPGPMAVSISPVQDDD